MRKNQLFKLLRFMLLLLTAPVTVFAQTTITGTVTDERGEPLVGATIRPKNAPGATIADVKGAFSIRISSDTKFLLISYTGYTSKEVPVTTASKDLKIRLTTDSRGLDDVVVIGYQNVKKSDLTGAVGSINAETISKSGALSVDQALQGRIPGVQMTQNTGLPGGGSSISIRGLNSINSTNEPIFVIDGVVISSGTGSYNVNAFSTINPADVESIDVLKDASATAIYGAQGANGVIIITTKKGKVGPPRMTVEAKFSTQELQR